MPDLSAARRRIGMPDLNMTMMRAGGAYGLRLSAESESLSWMEAFPLLFTAKLQLTAVNRVTYSLMCPSRIKPPTDVSISDY